MHLRRTKVAIGAVGVVAMIAFGATLASADGNEDGGHDGGEEETLPAPSLDPASGPPGTEVRVHGTECFEADHIDLRLFQGDTKLDGDHPTVNEDGTWLGYLVVPDDDALIGEELIVAAECNPVYDPSVFTVTGRGPGPTQPTTSTTTTAPGGGGTQPTTPTTAAPAGAAPAPAAQSAPPAAAPATPVAGQPAVAG
jgi:hypothetical protein